jgi:hypothetical protein
MKPKIKMYSLNYDLYFYFVTEETSKLMPDFISNKICYSGVIKKFDFSRNHSFFCPKLSTMVRDFKSNFILFHHGDR